MIICIGVLVIVDLRDVRVSRVVSLRYLSEMLLFEVCLSRFHFRNAEMVARQAGVVGDVKVATLRSLVDPV